ncbi:MAG: hypothetical protein ABI970_15650, partial [Chloroflexota bacterium]
QLKRLFGDLRRGMIYQLQHIAGSGITVDPFELFGRQCRRTLSSAMALKLEDKLIIHAIEDKQKSSTLFKLTV